MELLPLISIPVIYLLVAMLKPSIQTKLPFNVCAICIAVTTTWLILIVMWFFGVYVSLILLAILMGMSISGIMYKLEKFFSKKKLNNFWIIRIVIVVGCMYSVYALLNKQWNLLVLIAILGLILVSIFSLLFQGTTHGDVITEQKKLGRKSSIIKRLDDCC